MLLAPQRPSETEGFEEPISLSTWVESPRWAPELTATLEGNCRGSLLNDWAENIRDEWGQSAVELIQRGLEDVGLSLPESPNAKAWYPVGTQLRMMELLLDDIAGKDINALRKFLMKRLFRHRILRFMARRYGLRRILAQADAIRKGKV